MTDKNMMKLEKPPERCLAAAEGAGDGSAPVADSESRPSSALDREYFPRIIKETTPWDIYNNEARKIDRELVKDWTTSLNFLLVFVSACLPTF
jgi:Family of unknown function (DUF6535)